MNNKRYGMFYPETGMRVNAKCYTSLQEAIARMLDRGWSRIQSPADLAAFMNERTGVIFVIREIVGEGIAQE